MDVSLLTGANLPAKAYVSIRAGETRRQAPWKDGEVLHFPSTNVRGMTVDIFEKLGSAQVSLSALTAEKPLAKELSIARNDGTEITVGLQVARGAPSAEKPKAKPLEHSEELNKNKAYLEENNVHGLLSQLVQGLLAEKPQDCLAFMQSFVAAQRGVGAPLPASAPASPLRQQAAGGAPQVQGYEQTYIRGGAEAQVLIAADKGGLPNLAGHFSLLADALGGDASLFSRLSPEKTPMGVTLAIVMRPGLENRGHRSIMTPGVVAGDAACYDTFWPLYEKIMSLRWTANPRQPVLPPGFKQPRALDASEVDTKPIDSTGKSVSGVSVRLGRNLRELRFLPACSTEERRKAEGALTRALCFLRGEFEGEYLPLAGSLSYAPRPGGMTDEAATRLERSGQLFALNDSGVSVSSGLAADWPDARGVFAAKSGRAWAWVNEEEHLQLCATHEGNDLREAFAQACRLEAAVRPGLQRQGYEFAANERLGFLTVSPLNAGTGLCATVHLKIPVLGAQQDFRNTCRRLQLQARKVGLDTWAVSNSERLGSSEVEQVNAVIAGCRKLLDMEARLRSDGAEPASPTSPGSRRDSQVTFSNVVNFADVPGLGDGEYPGFPVDKCAEPMPNLQVHWSHAAEVLKKEPAIYDRLKDKATGSGVTFARVIKTGMDIAGHKMIKSMGAVAGDEESYTAFADLFDPLIAMRHGGFSRRMEHKSRLQDVAVEPLDPTGKHVLSVRFWAGRNIRGFRLPSAIQKAERRDVERLATQALLLKLQGAYYPLRSSESYAPRPGGMTVEEEKELTKANALFQEPDSSILLASGMGKHWPDARGVFATPQRDTVVWVNEEEHLRLLVERPGGDLREAFASFRSVHEALEAALREQGHGFMHSDRLGYVTSDPSNLGTGLTIGVTMSLPGLAAEPQQLKNACRLMQLEAKRLSGTNWEIRCSPLLGQSEVDAICSVARGVRQLLLLEEALAAGRPLLVPGLGPEALAITNFPCPCCPEVLPDLSCHTSVAAQVLWVDPELWKELQGAKALFGLGLHRLIKGCVDVRSSARAPIGLAAFDEGCYTTFAPLWARCLLRHHGASQAPPPRPLDPSTVAQALRTWQALALKPGGGEVSQVQVRLSRNLAGMRTPAACSLDERREVERTLTTALLRLSGDLEGEYHPLASSTSFVGKPQGMAKAEERQLQSQGLLFQEPKDPMLLVMGLGRDWPDARGVFSNGRGLGALINEEDHLSLVATLKGGDLQAAVALLRDAERALAFTLEQQGHRFAKTQQLGYVTTLPERLGTGLSVSAVLRLPQSLAACGDVAGLCASAGLQLERRLLGGSVEVSGKPSLGVSEAGLLRTFMDGCTKLLQQ